MITENEKQQIVNRISEKIAVSAYVDANKFTYNTIGSVVEEAILYALQSFKREMVTAIVDELYSDEKFENDIGLR